MLVFFVLGNVKVLSFALGDAKVPNANDFASQWNIGFNLNISAFFKKKIFEQFLLLYRECSKDCTKKNIF